MSLFSASAALEPSMSFGVSCQNSRRMFRLASAARRRTKAEHLGDEMREHLRLKEIGLLSAEEYETAKVRILDHHSPAAQPPLARAPTRP